MLQAEIGDDFRLYAWAGLNLLPFNLTFIKYVGCIFIYQIKDLGLFLYSFDLGLNYVKTCDFI